MRDPDRAASWADSSDLRQVVVVLLRVNVNLKAATVEDLVERRKVAPHAQPDLTAQSIVIWSVEPGTLSCGSGTDCTPRPTHLGLFR